MDGLDDALARAREAVRALAAASASSSDGGAARAKEASRLLREVERAVEVILVMDDRSIDSLGVRRQGSHRLATVSLESLHRL